MNHPTRQIEIDVPNGGGQIFTFQLFPGLHKQDDSLLKVNWNLVKVDPKPVQEDIGFIDVRFPPWQNAIEAVRERSVLVIQIADDPCNHPNGQYSWRFALNGIQYHDGESDFRRAITSSLSQDNTILTLLIDNIFGNASEQVNFSFVALRKNNKTGESLIFESKDPKVGVGHGPR